MNYLLDTCVISELTSKQPDVRVVEWIDSVNDERLFLSVITIGEIQRGVSKLPNSRRKHQLEDWLQSELLIRFRDRILPLTLEVMLTWGKLTARGRTLPAVDSLIAALAVHYDMYLVTRNVKDFSGTPADIFNPWET